MKKKFRTLLTEKCKDMGLTEKALDELTEQGVSLKGLTDDSTDEEVTAAVDLFVPFAKAMQAEITRKTRKPQSTPKPSNDEGNKGEGSGDEMPAWAKSLKDDLAALRQENENLKAEKAKVERAASITEKAKKLGIPDYLVKRVSFADDADIDKELNDLKQDLVNNNLMPKSEHQEPGTLAEQMKSDADSWAKSLPDK